MTTTIQRMRDEELSDIAIRTAERAEIAGRATPTPSPMPALSPAPVIDDIKLRFLQALADCQRDGYKIPYALITEAKAKLGDNEIDCATYDLAHLIDDVIIGVHYSFNSLCRELIMVHCTRRLAELKAIQAAEERQKIADAADKKARSGQFKRREK